MKLLQTMLRKVPTLQLNVQWTNCRNSTLSWQSRACVSPKLHINPVSRTGLFHTCSRGLLCDYQDNKTANPSSLSYNRIYSFPYVRTFRLLLRLKLYQTGFTVLFIPPMTWYYMNDAVSAGALQAACGISALAFLMLYVMTRYTQKTVGILDLSKDGSMLKIAHLTFWGGRKDDYVPTQEIIPLMDLPDNIADAYVNIKRYNTQENWLLFLRFGGITDKEKFEYVFGRLS